MTHTATISYLSSQLSLVLISPPPTFDDPPCGRWFSSTVRSPGNPFALVFWRRTEWRPFLSSSLRTMAMCCFRLLVPRCLEPILWRWWTERSIFLQTNWQLTSSEMSSCAPRESLWAWCRAAMASTDILTLYTTVTRATYITGHWQGHLLTTVVNWLGDWPTRRHLLHSQRPFQLFFYCMILCAACGLIKQFRCLSLGNDLVEDYSTRSSCSFTQLTGSWAFCRSQFS